MGLDQKKHKMDRQDLIDQIDEFISENWRMFLDHIQESGWDLTEDEYEKIFTEIQNQ